MFDIRDGEVRLAEDPATRAPDAALVFVGTIRSPWSDRADCPKNMSAASAAARPATLVVDEAYRPGLAGLEGTSHVVILTWLQHSPRDLIVQHPRHATAPRGVFSLRSPARPNPIGLHVARLVSLDLASGTLGLDAIDVLDGTPVIDLKPYLPGIDAFPDAVKPASHGQA